MYKKLGNIALATVVIFGAIFVFIQFAGNTYVSVQNRHIGVNVSVSGNKVPKNIQAISVQKQDSWTPPDQTLPLAPIVDITPSGPLPAPITMRFKLDRQATSDDVLLIATSESMNGAWEYLPATLSSDGWYATVEVKHLSFFDVIGASLKNLFGKFKSSFLDGVTGNLFTTAEKPKCSNEDQARSENYTITSDSKDSVYWCFGFENGTRVLKIVNHTNIPLKVDVNYLARITPVNPNFGTLNVDGNGDVLFPFDEIVYALSDIDIGGKETLHTSLSGAAEGFYALLNIASFAALFVGPIGKTGELAASTLSKTAADAAAKAATDAVAKVVADAAAKGEAVAAKVAVDAARTAKMLSILSDLLGDASCFNDTVHQDLGAMVKDCSAILAKVFKASAQVLLLIAIATLSDFVVFIKSVISAAADKFSDQTNYSITIGRTAPPSPNPPTQNPPTAVPQPPTVVSQPPTVVSQPPTVVPQPPTVVPQPPTVTPVSPPPNTWTEQEGDRGANSFSNPHNASGFGPHLDAMTSVQISCKLYAPEIQSVNPDGYWYRIATAPWNNTYYVAANTFWNGDIPGQKPYTHNTDWNVPNCP